MSQSSVNLAMIAQRPRTAAPTRKPNERLGALLDRARYVPGADSDAGPAGAPMARPASAPSLHLLVKQAKAAAAMPAPDEDALWLAARRGDEAGARKLLSRGAARTLEWRCVRYGGGTALHCACRHNHVDIVEMLVGAGADIEARTDAGLTPLSVAASMGYAPLCDELIRHGAHRGARTRFGCSPLWLAACYGHAAVVATLVEACADVEAKDIHRVTPLRTCHTRMPRDIHMPLHIYTSSTHALMPRAYIPRH